jgi:formate transporter
MSTSDSKSSSHKNTEILESLERKEWELVAGPGKAGKPIQPAANGKEITLDALLPPAMAEKAETIGIAKANMDGMTIFLLAVLAGAFIGLGGDFCTIIVTGTKPLLGLGVTKFLGGLAFCLGLTLVVIGGAELFTGNTLIMMATVSGKVSWAKLLRNWAIVYAGNFVGSVATAYFIYLSEQYKMGDNSVGITALGIAQEKCAGTFIPMFFKGIYCNVLVCLAVWLCFSARTSTDKILCIFFPVTAFVAMGFEHCIANMFFVPIGLFLKNQPLVVEALGRDLSGLTWGHFVVKNLVPVTLGNIVGGSGFVGIFYWLIYSRKKVN